MGRRFLRFFGFAVILIVAFSLLEHFWSDIPFEEAIQMMHSRFLRALVLFVILVPIFAIIEHLSPSIVNQPKLRRGIWLDTFYWFFTPMVIQVMSIIAIALTFLPIYLLLGRISFQEGALTLDWDSILAGYGPISQLPLWLQGAIAVVIGDFMGYWTHRMNHTWLFWDYHAVHHSGKTIDWLSAVRQHPVNDMISRVITASPIILLGFSPLAVEAYVPFLSAYIALIHANVSWHYGSFHRVLASPAFHRWHHTMDEEGLGKNLAGLFPIFDVIFGTFYMPYGQQPKNFGVSEPMPETFWGQMLYPFRNWKLIKRINIARG